MVYLFAAIGFIVIVLWIGTNIYLKNEEGFLVFNSSIDAIAVVKGTVLGMLHSPVPLIFQEIKMLFEYTDNYTHEMKYAGSISLMHYHFPNLPRHYIL